MQEAPIGQARQRVAKAKLPDRLLGTDTGPNQANGFPVQTDKRQCHPQSSQAQQSRRHGLAVISRLLPGFQLVQLFPLGLDQNAVNLFDGGLVEIRQFLSSRRSFATRLCALLERAESGLQRRLQRRQWCQTSGLDAISTN